MTGDYRYYNDRGQLITGTAAWIHIISQDGGPKAHYHKLFDAFLDEMIADRNLVEANPLAKEIRAKRGTA